MINKQLSVFLENKAGRLAEVTRIIANSDVDILALSIADTTDFGILRLIVNDINVAAAAVENAGLAYKITDVIAIEVDDKPGGLADALQIIEEAGIGIEYMYAFTSKNSSKAHVVLKVDNSDQAISVLQAKGINTISSNNISKL